ncbi:acyltransferase [Rhodoferax sp. AJA081-3]|uniref:acyltransferase family protein n=1 Tax=Rhodoferax sp. AJA081-3 TaxID=2752316 RepID=UPI001AE02869|nr:acyltransferase [Rhodoferax sp. AJA081-3]QTN26858.1 acyltransferase [Rhodoferax sp. AJA081-3]
MNRNEVLDGWRGMAILAVLAGHFLSLPYINLGRFGVELFFVLSGRLMGEILFVREENLLRFYWRRFSRIIPALYVFILICYFASQYLPDITIRPESAIAAATFTYNYLRNAGFFGAAVDHTWSLCIEEHTYIFLGVLAFVVRRIKLTPWKISLSLAVFCMLNGAYQSLVEAKSYYDVYWKTDTRAAGILLGCGLYCLYLDKPMWFDRITGNVIILLFIAALVLSLNIIPDAIKYSAGTTALAVSVTFLDRLPSLLKILISNPLFRYFGIASFSLYIWQQPFYVLIPQFGMPTMFLGALIFGLGSYYLVETPCRRVLNKFQMKAIAKPIESSL